MFLLYNIMTRLLTPLLYLLLHWRVIKGKEDRARLAERRGKTTLKRPDGFLVWIHAASVGEAQSTLILINRLSAERPAIQFLVTSGTVTSAALMASRLPDNAVHQYHPLDQATWVKNFLEHWKPDAVLWMESELWPNMLRAIRKRRIPAALINARLSDHSYRRWKSFKSIAHKLLKTFHVILAQTEKDKKYFKNLDAENVIVTDNLKHSAASLPCDDTHLQALKKATQDRPIWLYASTHDGEENLAAQAHIELKEKHPNLLTIIVPRHPERRDAIEKECKIMGLATALRGETRALPDAKTDIYIADTLGELGLFYTLTDIAMIGRSFSNDGGGGHNPIEAAQLNCAVMTGPNIQYQLQLFDEMIAANAAVQTQTKEIFVKTLDDLLSDKTKRQTYIERAQHYAQSKNNIIETVLENLRPVLNADKKRWYHVS